MENYIVEYGDRTTGTESLAQLIGLVAEFLIDDAPKLQKDQFLQLVIRKEKE